MSPWSGTGVLLANLLATCGPGLGREQQARPPTQRLWQWLGADRGEAEAAWKGAGALPGAGGGWRWRDSQTEPTSLQSDSRQPALAPTLV